MPKILVVDDEEYFRSLMKEELSEENYEVDSMENGYRLLERIEEAKPDLVLLDIKMVDYNGLDLLQDIRSKFYDLPVIICTAYDTYMQDSRSIAADYWVIKSFDLTELKSKISWALEAHDHEWGVKEIGDLSPGAIKQKLIRLLNSQGDPAPVADSVPGYATLIAELSKAGFSQEQLDEIDVMIKDMCNDFCRENQEATEFISDYLRKNYEEESPVFMKAMHDRARSCDLVSPARFHRLYEKEKGQFREKIHFLSNRLAAAEKDLSQGRLSKKTRDFLTKHAQIEHQTLDKLLQRWRWKLKTNDIKGIPIDTLVRTFHSLSAESGAPGKIQNVILREVRHDLKNVISKFTIHLKKLLETFSNDELDDLQEIRTRLTALLDRLSEEPEVHPNFRLKKVGDELDDVISKFTIHVQKLLEDISKDEMDELQEISTRLTALLDRLREISVFSAKLRKESFRLNNFMESLLEGLGIQKDPRITIQIEPQAEEINADPRFLGITLRQVIQNATEAVGPGGRIKIAVRSGAGGRHLQFVIEDDGPGIPENLLEEVFKPGVGYKKMGHGGMGLALCKEALNEIGGRISIHSVVDEGTTVEIGLYEET